jgi:deazaflavin-dependent oxidoreductase (nitroreductase family)
LPFDATRGTRGSRQPSGPLFRLINKVALRRLRRKGGKIMGFDALVLTTVGRKSGLERSNPVGRFPADNGGWLIVASAAGATDNPAWYYNLAANPDKVYMELDGAKMQVDPVQLHGVDRENAWQQIKCAAPKFAQYEEKTDRQLPIIRLVPKL